LKKLMMLLFIGLTVFAQELPKEQKTQIGKVNPEEFKLMTRSESGEMMEAEGLTVKETRVVDQRFVPRYREDGEMGLKGATFYDRNGKKTSIELSKVTLFEYWNEFALSQNKYWDRARGLEKEFQGSEEFEIISVYHNPGLYKGDQVPAHLEKLKKKGIVLPETLVFDIEEVLRERVLLPGPSTYFLVDHRQQAVVGGRGNEEETIAVFDEISNSLKNLRKEGYLPNGKN